MVRMTRKPIVFFLIFSFLLLEFSIPAARARMISSETAMEYAGLEDGRALITAFVCRQDVQQAMVEQGVDLAEVEKRIAGLSDREAMKLANVLDQLPAGGDGLGGVVGAIVLIFFVLLITDLLGLTTVFPFVKR